MKGMTSNSNFFEFPFWFTIHWCNINTFEMKKLQTVPKEEEKEEGKKEVRNGGGSVISIELAKSQITGE